MASKRPQTMAKLARERDVKERRARKLEKKRAAAAERKANAAEAGVLGGQAPDNESSQVATEPSQPDTPGLP